LQLIGLPIQEDFVTYSDALFLSLDLTGLIMSDIADIILITLSSPTHQCQLDLVDRKILTLHQILAA